MEKPQPRDIHDLLRVCRYIETKYNLTNAELFDNLVALRECTNGSTMWLEIDWTLENIPPWFPEEGIVALQRMKDEYDNSIYFSVSW